MSYRTFNLDCLDVSGLRDGREVIRCGWIVGLNGVEYPEVTVTDHSGVARGVIHLPDHMELDVPEDHGPLAVIERAEFKPAENCDFDASSLVGNLGGVAIHRVRGFGL